MPLSSRQGPGNANQSTTRPAKYLAVANVTTKTLPSVVASVGNHFNQQALQFVGNSAIYIGQSNVANSAANWSASGNVNSQNGGATGNLWFGNIGQFTVEGWFYFTTVPTTATGILDFGGQSSGNITANAGLTISIANVTRIFTARTNNGYDANFNWTGGTGLSSNTWTHIAVQRSAYNGNNYQSAWINGTIANNAPFLTNPGYSGQNPTASGSPIGLNTPFIGGAVGSQFLGYNGNTQIQEFRISNIARYPTAGNISVPTSSFVNDPNTLLLIHGNSATTDDNS